MNFNKTIFLILVLGLGMIISSNYAQADNTKLLSKNTKVDITSDDSEIEVYNSSEDLFFIKPQHNSVLHQQRKKTIAKKIFQVLLIASGVTIALFLYLKLTGYCYRQEENC
jgi:hypothetical protein